MNPSALLRWYQAHRHATPAAPFVLSAGRTVTDRGRFLAALDRDVALGASGPRWGVLADDLAALKAVVDSNAERRAVA